jgi:hypothetical protein
VTELKRRGIIERQLIGQGLNPELVRKAVASGPDAVAALRESQVSTSSSSSSAAPAAVLSAIPAPPAFSAEVAHTYFDSLRARDEGGPAFTDAGYKLESHMERELVLMGFKLDDVRAAARRVHGDVSCETVLQALLEDPLPGADSLPAAAPPLPPALSAKGQSKTAEEIANAQRRAAARENKHRLQDAGFAALHVAAALDECHGDADGALALLLSGWQPQVTAAFAQVGMATAAVDVIAVGATRNCALCAAASPGLECLGQTPHFFCKSCFEELVTEAGKKDGRVRCPVPQCRAYEWSYASIAQHVGEECFREYLKGAEGRREAAFKEREGKLKAESSALEAERKKLLRSSWATPEYWSEAPTVRRWKIVPASRNEWAALAKVTALKPEGALGGRDQRLGGTYSGFKLQCAWRIENHDLFAKYAVEKQHLQSSIATLRQQRVAPVNLRLRDGFWKATRQLPGADSLDRTVNEVYLAHGTKPDTLLSVITGGLNERFSGGLFGQGTYFAEDIAKNDQYVTQDTKLGDHKELHELLYDRVRHPGKIFYVFLCRVAFGHFCRTKDANTNMDTGAGLWSSAQRELAAIPGTAPSELHHGLLSEVGGTIQRYREFITFHGDRIYPEYLLAYHRV